MLKVKQVNNQYSILTYINYKIHNNTCIIYDSDIYFLTYMYTYKHIHTPHIYIYIYIIISEFRHDLIYIQQYIYIHTCTVCTHTLTKSYR